MSLKIFPWGAPQCMAAFGMVSQAHSDPRDSGAMEFLKQFLNGIK